MLGCHLAFVLNSNICPKPKDEVCQVWKLGSFIASAFRNTYWYPSHSFHLFSLAFAFVSQDPCVTQTQGLCSLLVGVAVLVLMSQMSQEGPAPLWQDWRWLPLTALQELMKHQHLSWFHLHCEWSCKPQRNTFFSFKPFAFSKGRDKLPGRAEHGAQRNCVQTNLFLLWAFKLQLAVSDIICCSELLTASFFWMLF